MPAERTRAVCDALAAAVRRFGCPEQIWTDNGRVFTGRFNHPPVEVLFDRICRENGIEHLLTAPRSPTTTGTIERFHRTMRLEFDTRRVFGSLKAAQQALDEWVEHYNDQRPHQSLDGATPAEKFQVGRAESLLPVEPGTTRRDRTGAAWVSRRVAVNGVISVAWQQVCVGAHYSGASSTCTSPISCCRSGPAANWSRPLPGPTPERRSARRTHPCGASPNLNRESQGSTDIDPSPIYRSSSPALGGRLQTLRHYARSSMLFGAILVTD
jgi:hypothetical protein